jgi:hypothetical protein
MRDPFRIIAIISAFNEGDIISAVIRHLVENGIDVYLLDDHSTDDTVQKAKYWLGRGLLNIETFTCDEMRGGNLDGVFALTSILRRKEELANELRADWLINHDADEIRESPWPNTTLKDAIQWVDKLGYNCIDHHIINFPPVDDGFRATDDPRTYFTHWEQAPEIDKVRRNAWKATDKPVSLAPSGACSQ